MNYLVTYYAAGNALKQEIVTSLREVIQIYQEAKLNGFDKICVSTMPETYMSLLDIETEALETEYINI